MNEDPTLAKLFSYTVCANVHCAHCAGVRQCAFTPVECFEILYYIILFIHQKKFDFPNYSWVRLKVLMKTGIVVIVQGYRPVAKILQRCSGAKSTVVSSQRAVRKPQFLEVSAPWFQPR